MLLGGCAKKNGIPPHIEGMIRQLMIGAMDAGHQAGVQRLLAAPGSTIGQEGDQAVLTYAAVISQTLEGQGMDSQTRSNLVAGFATCYGASYVNGAKGKPLAEWKEKTLEAFIGGTYDFLK